MQYRICFILAVFVLALACSNAPGNLSEDCVATTEAPLYTWVQIGPNGEASVRAIMAGNKCPRVAFGDDNCPQMETRAAKGDGFDVLACEKNLEDDAQSVAVLYLDKFQTQRQELPLPSYNDAQIAVIGDTGCGDGSQNCTRPSDWPFEKISNHVAATNPDLIIHVGDYAYRTVNKSKDNWEVWNQDFFKPGKSMFAKAPFLFARGNHEQCKEAFRGWFRFLEPRPYRGDECQTSGEPLSLGQITEPYVVEWGEMKLLMLDSSSATDGKPVAAVVEALKKQMIELNDTAGSYSWNDAWLITHRVTWGCAPSLLISCPRSGETLRAAWTAWRRESPTSVINIKKFLAGHVHLFSAADFKDEWPLQIIVGNSGASLNGTTVWDISDGSRTVSRNSTMSKFGFVTIGLPTPAPDQSITWHLNVYDQDASIPIRLQVSGNRFVDQ